MFFKILLIGWSLIITQAIASFCDGYLYQSQMNALGIYGWAFIEHGGMWADFLIISPVVAFIVSEYPLPYLSTRSFVIIGLIIAVAIFAGNQYRQMGAMIPEAGSHDGYTTIAGWIHGLYALISAWIIVLFLVSPFTLNIQRSDLVIIAALLSVWAVIGVIKFNPRWAWDHVSIRQVLVEVSVIWVTTGGKIFLQR